MPENGVGKNREFTVEVENNSTFVDALAKVDKNVFENPEKSHFTKDHRYIRSYLQLFWDPEENEIYSDIKFFAAAPQGLMPIKKNIKFNLFDNSEISLTSSS